MNIKRLCIFITSLIVLMICVGTTGYIIADSINSKDNIAKLQEIAYSNTEKSNNENGNLEVTASATTETQTKEVEKSFSSGNANTSAKTLIPVDIAALQKTNRDIFAWVNIPGTTIDYPIAQHPKDDTYYLKHGANGMASKSGCPYIELSDSKTFMEFNTVIYGHNMNDGSMFGALHKYEDKTFSDQHRQINIYTAEHAFSYKVFAAVMYSDKWIPGTYNDKIESDRTAFLTSLKTESVKGRSFIYDDIEVTEDNIIVTFSTCDKKLRDNRFMVVAVLEKIDGKDVGLK